MQDLSSKTKPHLQVSGVEPT